MRNEGVRRCLLSVRNVCECLRLPLVMSKICQGCHGSVWRYLRMAGGCLEVVEGEGGLKGVSGSIWEVTNEILDIFR